MANIWVNGSYLLNLSLNGVGQVSISDNDTSQFGESSSNSDCKETFSFRLNLVDFAFTKFLIYITFVFGI